MKRALLVGINNYPDPDNKLNGCLNDIADMAAFLNGHCGFAKSAIRLLTDRRATTKAITERLAWLIKGVRPGDTLFFHYSGHGAQVATRSGKGELDGLDEVICPVDFDWKDAHMIKDKDFQKIFSKIPKGVDFIWVSDSCHSADLSRAFTAKLLVAAPTKTKPRRILPPPDLEWRIRAAKENKVKEMTMAKAPVGLNVALISGCKSDQTSADAYIKGRYNGAMTYHLLAELRKRSGQSQDLKKLVSKVNAALKGKFTQQPQIEGAGYIISKGFLHYK